MVGSSDVSRLTDLEGSLSWSYRTCPVFILDVSSMDGQRPTASFQMPRGSGVLMVGSSGMRREFRHLTYFNSVIIVFKCAEGREFRRESGVPAFIGSSDASQLHCNLVTVSAV